MAQTNVSHYNLIVEEVKASTEFNESGLDQNEVKVRLKRFGHNVLPQIGRKPLWRIFLHQFQSPLIYVLLVAAIASIMLDDIKDAILIGIILLINAVLGTWQEYKAEENAAALQDMVKVKARVKRNGNWLEIQSDNLVPGDLISLESGNKVPADIRLISCNALEIEEGLITGESFPIKKNTEKLEKEDLPIGDRVNMAYSGTIVNTGRGTGIVVQTGLKTELGKIANALKETGEIKAPLIERMERFATSLSFLLIGVCLLIGIVGYLQGRPMMEMVFVMVAAGVSAIPEGLPVALTVALSVGTSRMAKKNVIVRKLPAVEGLGSCSVVASDKTGTLTVDQQSVTSIITPSGRAYKVTGAGYNANGKILIPEETPASEFSAIDQLVKVGLVANEASLFLNEKDHWEHSGDAMDVALLALGKKYDEERLLADIKTEEIIPFESERKYSGVIFSQSGTLYLGIKGAVEVIVNYLPEEEAQNVLEVTNQLAKDGFRVLGFASGSIQNKNEVDNAQLNFLGLAAFKDPLRPEAKLAVEQSRKAGVRVLMVTGDHPETAFNIAQELGIASKREEVISGPEFSKLENDMAKLSNTLKSKTVFSRVSPLQKLAIVSALRDNGEFVAVTGDGANDAPALKAASIGVAMGAGTDLAKEAASLIITDNKFSSLVTGIEEGRKIYNNLRKLVWLLLSTGFAELALILVTMLMGLPLPFTAVQLLWLNVVTNGIQDIALAFERGNPKVMQHKPRKAGDSVFDFRMISHLSFSTLVITILCTISWYDLNTDGHTLDDARSYLIMLMVIIQNFMALVVRSETKSIFKIPFKNNPYIIGAVLLAQGLHIAATYIPFTADLLGLKPIPLHEWLELFAYAFIVLVAMEAYKVIVPRIWRAMGHKEW